MIQYRIEKMSLEQLDNWGGLQNYLNKSLENGYKFVGAIPILTNTNAGITALTNKLELTGYQLIFEYELKIEEEK